MTLAIDFFTVPTATFDILYVFVVLSLERRLILNVSVTAHPYAEWAAQQIVEAGGEAGAFKLDIHDRDGILGAMYGRRLPRGSSPTAHGVIMPEAHSREPHSKSTARSRSFRSEGVIGTIAPP